MLVHHLDDADHRAADEDGHAEDGLGAVAGELVDGTVETGVGVGVDDVEDFSCHRHLSKWGGYNDYQDDKVYVQKTLKLTSWGHHGTNQFLQFFAAVNR